MPADAKPTRGPDLPTPDALQARLAELIGERGFLLPHHGALAAAAPDLHDAYRVMYRALTLTDRHLSAFEREFVWLCILVASEEGVGTHHVDLFRTSGGTIDQASLAFQLAGYASASKAFGFLERNWTGSLPGLDPRVGFQSGLDRLVGDRVSAETAILAVTAVHTILRQPWGLRAGLGMLYHLPGAVDDGREARMVEALSLVMWPGGVNRFVDATFAWFEMIRAGEVAPSPLFRAWAETPGLGAFAPKADTWTGPDGKAVA